jgi:hypothetical protein
MATNRIGWTLQTFGFTIKAGSGGAYQFTLNVTTSDGSALPTYDGWTCEIAFFGNFAPTAALTKNPTVTGDSGAKTLTFTLSFDEADTIDLTPGDYTATVWMTDPTDGEIYAPAKLTLTVENHNV